jgi:tetratricopeptide (TPR) repeat protein
MPARPMRPLRNLVLLTALGAAPLAVPALAQTASDYPPPCDASQVTKADIDRAHTVFLSGKQYLEESNYDKAISYFKDAYSIDCSRHAMLPIIASAYERKGDKTEAVRALEEYTKRAPNAPDHDVIERRIRNLKDQLAREQPPPSTTASAPAGSASASPQPSAAMSAEAAPAASAPPPSVTATSMEAPGGHSALPWILVGVGGAAAITGVVLYAVGSPDLSNADKACPNRMCATAAAQSQGNNARTLVNAGGGLIGGGLAVAAAGLIWHFLEKTDEGPGGETPAGQPKQTSQNSAHVRPVVAPGYAGIAIGSTL